MSDPTSAVPNDSSEPSAGEAGHGADRRAEDDAPFARFVLWCAGANPSHLREKAERRWYHSLGVSVIFTALVAGASAYVLAMASFDPAWQVLTAIAVFWALLVFNLDRLIVSRVLGIPTFWNKVGLFVSRFALATFVALTMAVGIELLVFSPEIEQRIVELNVEDQQRAERETRTRAEAEYAIHLGAPGLQEDQLDRAVKAAEVARQDADRRVKCETQPAPDCESGTGVPGVGAEALEAAAASALATDRLAEAQAAYDNYAVIARPTTLTAAELETCGYPAQVSLTRQQEDSCKAQQLVEARVQELASAVTPNTDGMIRRLVALSDLAGGEHGAAVVWGRVLIFGIAFMVDLVPLSAKLFGGATGHDMRARRDSIAASNEYLRELNTSVRKEPHFLDKTRRTNTLLRALGFAPDYDDAAAEKRANHYGELFERQREIQKSYWGTVPPARFRAAKNSKDGAIEDEYHQGASDAGYATDGEDTPTRRSGTRRESFSESNPVHPPEQTLRKGRVLKTKKGVEYIIEKSLQTRMGTGNELWFCRKSGVEDAYYVAKVSDERGHRALKRDSIVSQFSSPYVIHLDSGSSVDRDDETGLYFIVMPYYSDGDLTRYQKKCNRRIPLPIALNITEQLLEGLGDAHGSGAIHCDIKPANILLDLSNGDSSPKIVITDFGASKMMEEHGKYGVTNAFNGTREYAPVEQIVPGSRFGSRSYATDLWSVAAVLYMMLVNLKPRAQLEQELELNPAIPRTDDGKVNFESYQYQQWLVDEMAEIPRLDAVDPTIPRPIADLVALWLSKDPAERAPGFDLFRKNDRSVMDDALERLQNARVMSR